MQYTTKAEKATVLKHLHAYSYDNPLTIRRYRRLMAWLNGETALAIAQKEGVTKQAVAQSVRRDLKKILEFAKNNNKL